MSIQAMHDLSVDCAFPGGNIIVDAVEGDTVAVHQDLRDTEIDWFYWYFRVRGASGRMLTVRFTASDVIGVRGPAMSTDGGWTWRWLGRDCVQEQSFHCWVPDDADEVRFSMGMPYVGAHWHMFLDSHLGHPALASEVLCTSRHGRPVELVRVGLPASQAAYRVLLTCRHHACEMMASSTLEGILQAVLASDDVGRWFQENVTVLVVPFVDKDGVEEGDQGKCRRPHDHNRDYADQSLYPEVRAIRERIPELIGGGLDFFLDLHCPWIRGPLDEVIYLVGEPEERLWRQLEAFSTILEASRTGPLPHDRRDNLPFGQSWNNEEDSLPKRSAGWAKSLPGIRFASLIEIPYANAGSVEVNTASARAFGRDLARAMHLYLDECGR